MIYKVMIVILVSLVAFIVYWYMNKTVEPKEEIQSIPTKKLAQLMPSEMHPFFDLSEYIDPSILPGAKDDYNDIILTLFDLVNKQKKVLNKENIAEYNKEITTAISPKLNVFRNKYTPEVAGKLLKYFLTLHITALLDNYYTGPPIDLMVPPIPFLKMNSFPFMYKSKTKNKVVNASTLIPFKYLVYNIPKNIRKEVTTIYDNMIDRYAQAVNDSVSKLSELNMITIKQVNVGQLMMKYQQMMTTDLNRIKQLYGDNIYKISKNVFMKNIVPLLDTYYKGPGIDWTQDIPGNAKGSIKRINIKYPNTNKKNIFEITETSTPSSSASSSAQSSSASSSRRRSSSNTPSSSVSSSKTTSSKSSSKTTSSKSSSKTTSSKSSS